MPLAAAISPGASQSEASTGAARQAAGAAIAFSGADEARMAIAQRLWLRGTRDGSRIHCRTEFHPQSGAGSAGGAATAAPPLDAAQVMAARAHPEPQALPRRTRLRSGFSARRILLEPTRPDGRSALYSPKRSARPPPGADLLLQSRLLRSASRSSARCATASRDKLPDGRQLSRDREKGSRPENGSSIL